MPSVAGVARHEGTNGKVKAIAAKVVNEMDVVTTCGRIGFILCFLPIDPAFCNPECFHPVAEVTHIARRAPPPNKATTSLECRNVINMFSSLELNKPTNQ